MILIKQSTQADFQFGPFVDSADGETSETGLTISVRLSKNGSAWAAQNNPVTPPHSERGFYSVRLDSTDTNTVGSLVVSASPSGAVPVKHEFMVLPAMVYNSIVAGTDTLEVDTVAVSGDATAADNLEAAADGTGYNLGGGSIVAASVTDSAAIATAVLTASNGVETGYTLQQAMRLVLAANAGKLSGAATTEVSIRDVGDSKNRIVATVDASGNRSAVTLDAT